MIDDRRLFLTIAQDLASVNDVMSKMAKVGKDGLSITLILALAVHLH